MHSFSTSSKHTQEHLPDPDNSFYKTLTKNQQYKKYQQNVLVVVHVNPYTQLKNNTQNLKVLQTK